ncbi:uncharacterized protein LOC131153968 [Malania oleifera]|uniref:uncharacterized protein LOC131153968 n=1 Tax=Malania oleifera TaxID=397392 RepID=UPI0025AE2368|nr:uncharacterized protein LOC131153968 [Malania oleifera]
MRVLSSLVQKQPNVERERERERGRNVLQRSQSEPVKDVNIFVLSNHHSFVGRDPSCSCLPAFSPIPLANFNKHYQIFHFQLQLLILRGIRNAATSDGTTTCRRLGQLQEIGVGAVSESQPRADEIEVAILAFERSYDPYGSGGEENVKTGPSFADAAMGRIAQGTKVLAEGGYEKIFCQTFETVPEELLQNSYACYLSTSAGPVMGILYVSTAKLAFCSDNPLSYKDGDQTEWSYYKESRMIRSRCAQSKA